MKKNGRGFGKGKDSQASKSFGRKEQPKSFLWERGAAIKNVRQIR